MDEDEPGGEDVDDVVEEVGVGGAVESGVDGEDVEERVCDVSQPGEYLVSKTIEHL